MRTCVLWAAALIGCGGRVTGRSEGRELGLAGGSATDTFRDASAASGGRSGGIPLLPPDSSATDASGEAGTPSDGALSVCPIRVPGGVVSGADCYACIAPNVQCDPVAELKGILPPVKAADCAGRFSHSLSFQCEWFPEPAAINVNWGASFLCKSNPGVVICGGGL